VPCSVDEVVIGGAELLPSIGREVLSRHFRNILSKDDGEASIQVPVNVAVEEPWARVVGEEADGDIVASIADTDDVADYGIDEVVG